MSTAETISSLISLLAVLISAIALIRARKTQSQLIALEKVHAELSRRQIDDIEARIKQEMKANLSVRLEKYGKGYKFVVANKGASTASNIYFGLEAENEHNPLVSGDFEQKIPFRSLAPGDEYYLLAFIPINITQGAYEVALRWDNLDGTQDRVRRTVAR